MNLHRTPPLALALIILSTWAGRSYSLDQKQLIHEEQLTNIARSRCDSEQIEGSDYKIKVLGDGKLEISILGKKGGDIQGKLVVEKAAWEGQQQVLREHQAQVTIDRRECIQDELKFLRESYKPPEKTTTPINPVEQAATLDIRGNWSASFPAYGEQQQWRFYFDTHGSELYGSAHTWQVYSPEIHEGKINGKYIYFKTVWRNRWSTDPRRIRDVWTVFRGELTPSGINFTALDEDGIPLKFTATRN